MNYVKDKTFSEERALYNVRDTVVENCRFAGEEDGESFLKECENITVKNCFMDLRYPMWHVDNLTVQNCEMTKNCRAALWYDNGVRVENSLMNGIKALRECVDVTLKNVTAESPEFCWRCDKIKVDGGSIISEYAFFESRNIEISDLEFSGKYSFQYVENLTVKNSKLKTKDAFWHAKNVTVTDSELYGEYLGWYSEGLTLIRCHIRGTQPLCYCKNLKLVDCTMENCDLSFEYSEVDADIKGEVLSVKNPASGKIVADGYGEIILSDSKYKCIAEIIKRR
ncbi:MAG: DUF3737 family protein [Clostridia bacterium]|nr:DUF3737 family protein [Clostridia bacterium]